MTNTVPHEIQKMQCHKIKTVDISIMLVEAIRRIHNNESMSYLFRNIALEDWSQDIITFYLLFVYVLRFLFHYEHHFQCFTILTCVGFYPSFVSTNPWQIKRGISVPLEWYLLIQRGTVSYISCNWVIFCHNKWVEISCCFIMTVS